MTRSWFLIFLSLAGCTPLPPTTKSWASGTGWMHDPEKHEEAFNAAKTACETETGESSMPSFWSGYSRPFVRLP